ncbi:MAG TPA: aminomethyl-transferring glycine dehydrogenase subunit GcvPA [Candidatus Methylomirabilis sp.]|nr:aminomethyl-transferring glycine dehydrogenase subunit GcvPA [Candidatus Methylomirabilis sp.]
MPYIPHTEIEIKEMLKQIGVTSVDELFADIPEELLYDEKEPFPGKSEREVVHEIGSILMQNKIYPMFSGAGCYNHYVPAVVKAIISRGEFFTSYTQYQPELSQGFLRALFEYQTFICQLTGMDVSNASMYDWASSLGEAALMAARIKKERNKIIIPGTTHPARLQVLKTYVRGAGFDVIEVGYDAGTGQLDIEKLKSAVNDKTAMVYMESPNFFGVIDETAPTVSKIAHEAGSLFIFGTDMLSLSVLRPPADFGADIVIGDAQSFGNPVSFGGSQLGVIACKKEHVRDMPGRLVGETHDKEGRKGYVLTLQTREQHIRRQKATSNITTNHALNALAASVYIAWMGAGGLSELGSYLVRKPKEVAEKINSSTGWKAPLFDSHHFREFVAVSDDDPDMINRNLLEHGITGGFSLRKWYPELGNAVLYCVTECCSDENIERLVGVLHKK